MKLDDHWARYEKAKAAPKFSPASFTALDPNSLQYTSPSQANQLATQYDQTAYNASDADLAARS